VSQRASQDEERILWGDEGECIGGWRPCPHSGKCVQRVHAQRQGSQWVQPPQCCQAGRALSYARPRRCRRTDGACGQGDVEADGRRGHAQLWECWFSCPKPTLQDDLMEANATGAVAGLQRPFEGPLHGGGKRKGSQVVALADSALGDDRRGVYRHAFEPQT
jgi:hypothetical protein